MDILSAVERVDQRPAPRKMRQEPQFDLRVVRTDQDVRRVARHGKKRRISRPSSSRTGIFCKFGSLLDSLPVEVTV